MQLGLVATQDVAASVHAIGTWQWIAHYPTIDPRCSSLGGTRLNIGMGTQC